MGTRVFLLTQLTALQDHPHAYGDKSKGFCTFKQALGSSPRVWGQGKQFRGRVSRSGIIPTRMGTSVPGKDIFNVQQDHPHAYGDKLYHRIFDLSRGGSSPRVWGQVVDDYYIHNDSGIIPTRMGTSTSKLQK